MVLSFQEKARIVIARVLLIILAPVHSFLRSRSERSSFIHASYDPSSKQRQMFALLAIVAAVVGISWAGASITGSVIANQNTITNLTEELGDAQQTISSLVIQKVKAESDVAQCNEALISCNDRLATSSSDLGICKTDLSVKTDDLNSCVTTRDSYKSQLDGTTNNLNALETNSAKTICGCPSSPAGEVKKYNVENNAIVCTNSGTKSVTC